MRTSVTAAIQVALEAVVTEALAAEQSERVGGRLGYRSGFYSRSLITDGEGRRQVLASELRHEPSSGLSETGIGWGALEDAARA